MCYPVPWWPYPHHHCGHTGVHVGLSSYSVNDAWFNVSVRLCLTVMGMLPACSPPGRRKIAALDPRLYFNSLPTTANSLKKQKNMYKV